MRKNRNRPESDEPLSEGRVEYLEAARQRVRNRRIRRTAVLLVLLTAVVLFATGIAGSSVAALKDLTDTARIALLPGSGWPQQTGVAELEQMAPLTGSFVELGDEGCVVWSRTGKKLNSIQSGYARPALAAGKSRFVLYNRSGNELRVESRTQNLYTKTMDSTISLCAVADAGQVAVVTDSTDSVAKLTVYNSSMQQQLVWNLTSEQMYNVANNATDLYSKIKQYADDGYENASQYMDSYIEYWKQLDELEDTYREKLTDTSFDTIRDEFKNQLLDMESDAEDFAEDFEKMMQQAVVESMMSDTYANRLKEWYKSFANSMTDGTLSSTEQSNLKSQWEQMVSDALAERNAIMQAMGWDSSSSEQQSASSRGFGTEMTHEDAGELSGRFTAVYESNLRIETAEQQQTVAITELRGSISSLIVQANGLYNIADETRTILANSYLELQQIRENTEDSAKYLKDIKADIAEVKHNTARL